MLTLYTDGSCWPNPSANGGWSFVVYDQGEEIASQSGGAGEMTSNNRMEMTAVLRALEWLGDRSATVYSDSQYVVNGINSWVKGWERKDWMRMDRGRLVPVLNSDLWRALALARLPQHHITWCRGHSGITGNERADALAEAARTGVAI